MVCQIPVPRTSKRWGGSGFAGKGPNNYPATVKSSLSGGSRSRRVEARAYPASTAGLPWPKRFIFFDEHHQAAGRRKPARLLTLPSSPSLPVSLLPSAVLGQLRVLPPASRLSDQAATSRIAVPDYQVAATVLGTRSHPGQNYNYTTRVIQRRLATCAQPATRSSWRPTV